MLRKQAPGRNILFVSYAFPPTGGPGVQRSAKFAKYLPDFHYRPLVLAGDVRDLKIPVDHSLRKDVAGTTVFRCRGNERFLAHVPRRLRFLHALRYRPDLFMAWLSAAEQTALRIARRLPIAAIYTTAPPHSSALLGLRLKKRLRVPWIVDFRDPWTDGFNTTWPTKLHYRMELYQERRVVETADAVILVTPTRKDAFARKYPRCAGKMHLIPNGFDREDISPSKRGADNSALRIGFTGALHNYNQTFNKSQLGPVARLWAALFSFQHGTTDYSTESPFYLLHALRALIDERPDFEDRIRLSFAGNFGEHNLGLVRKLGLDRLVSVKGYLPHIDSVRLLMESDVLFLPVFRFVDGPRNYHYPGKIFEYLGTHKPILAAVPEGDARELVQRARAGWCVDPRDVDTIKALLKQLAERKTAGTLKTDPDKQFIMQFERREQTGQLAALFDSLLSGRQLPEPQPGRTLDDEQDHKR